MLKPKYEGCHIEVAQHWTFNDLIIDDPIYICAYVY